jgi:hypothetical protein
MRRIVILLMTAAAGALCTAFLNCGGPPKIEMNVVSYSDPDAELPTRVRFTTVELGMTGNPLLEKQLLAILRDSLVAHGHIYSPDSSEISIGLTGYIGPYQEYVPPRTISWPKLETSSTSLSGYVGTTRVSGNASTSKWTTQQLQVGGGVRTSYYRRIWVGAAGLLPNSDSVSLVWTGEAESFGSTGDLLIVAPYLLREIVSEFPHRSGRPAARRQAMTR